MPNRNFFPEPQNSGSIKWRIPLSAPSYTEEEARSINNVLKSGWLTSGPETYQLEREFEDYLGVRHAIAVTNGTAALYLAFLALGMTKDDEVVTPALNFVAAANTILHAGGIPRFADVASPDAPLVSAQTLERAITPKTRGICLMHYGGYPCAMNAIIDLAREHQLWVVEDAAHAPGAAYNGIPCGKWGDVACFSFFGNKNITCAEGGLVVTGRDDVAERLRLLRSHGMDSLTWDRYKGHCFSYDVTVPGFNFRLDDLRATFLRIQLRSLESINLRREERVHWYQQFLGKDPRWILPFDKYRGKSAFHLFTVVLADEISRSELMQFMKDWGIQCSIHYPPVHQFTFYRNLPHSHADLPITESLGRQILSLPLFSDMTQEQVEYVCTTFREAVDQQMKRKQ